MWKQGDLPMSHILRPPSEKTFPIADALAGIPRCVMLVESALLDLLKDPRDDHRRQKARDLVRSLSSGCPECGFKEPESILRKLTSLLAVPPGGSAAIERSLADRLLEQVGLLKAHAQVRRP
jgi:hypothetical protein